MQDSLINLDYLTVYEDDTLFKIERKGANVLYDSETVPLYILVEMKPDLLEIERTGYTILDLFSDVGGIAGLLYSGSSILLSFLNHNYFDNYMVSKLFLLGNSHNEDPTSTAS